MERDEQLEQWVHQRLSAAQPATEWPDLSAARTRFEQRAADRRGGAWLWLGAAAAACAIVFLVPASRAIAQRLWDSMVLGRIQVLITDFDTVGPAVMVFSPEMHAFDFQDASSVEDASRLAGFMPRLPADVFVGAPSYSVSDVQSAKLRLRAPAIRSVLRQAGGSPADVPDNWDGVVLDMRAGPVVMADYGEAILLQSLPFQLITPADFDLELFYRVAFRSLGMREDEARALGGNLGLSPALLMFMPKEDRELLQAFKTTSGTGVMIAEVYGAGKTSALWAGSDRLYALHGNTAEVTPQFAARVANALD